MRRVIFIILGAIMCMLGEHLCAQERIYKYVDASTLNIIGKPSPVAETYARVDTLEYRFDDPGIMKYGSYSTGLAVLFKTDSRNISAKWITSASNLRPNLTGILQKGLDLYIKDGEQWVYAGVGVPQLDQYPHDSHQWNIVENMAEGVKECLLYLPIFDTLDSLQIGIDADSNISAMENPFRHKIVFKGSSITHGASASRPGMTYPARFGRDNGFYVCNLGFSGRSKLQKEFARMISEMEADAFVFDTFSNPDGETIYSRFDEFVDIIRSAHPATPLIFLQTERQEMRNFNQWKDGYESAKQKAGEEVVRRRMKKDPHMYFIDSDGFLGEEHIGTVDGTHPNDLGFTYMLDIITPEILKILEKYGIR